MIIINISTYACAKGSKLYSFAYIFSIFIFFFFHHYRHRKNSIFLLLLLHHHHLQQHHHHLSTRSTSNLSHLQQVFPESIRSAHIRVTCARNKNNIHLFYHHQVSITLLMIIIICEIPSFTKVVHANYTVECCMLAHHIVIKTLRALFRHTPPSQKSENTIIYGMDMVDNYML